MALKISDFQSLLNGEFKRTDMVFDDSKNWRSIIPARPGWYFLRTNMPWEELGRVAEPEAKDRHYNIPKRVKASDILKEQVSGACIPPSSKNGLYIVYFGETADLKARAREHVSGSTTTACLAIQKNIVGEDPTEYKYKWEFNFLECPFDISPTDSKLIRVFGEQLWRARHGWPVLCAR